MKNKEVLEEEFQQNNNNVVLQTMIVTSALLAFIGVKYLNVTQIKMLMIHHKIISSCNKDAFLIMQ